MTDEEATAIQAWIDSATFKIRTTSRREREELQRTVVMLNTLLGEVMRLRARDVALVEIARAVATEDTLAYESDAGDDQRCVFCYGVKDEHGISAYQHVSDYHEWQHASDCPVTKARALLDEEKQP